MLTRTRPNSFALSGAFTRSVQSTGRSTGQVDTVALIASSPCILAHRPLQRQCSARATNPAPHSVPVDVPQDGQQMFVARHRESLKPEPSLIQMTVPDGPVRDPPTHRMRVCQPTEEGRHLAVCVRPDGEVPVVGQDAGGQDADRVPLVRLDHDPLERLEVGVLAEEVHLADRSVQHMVHLPAGCFSRCSWHG